MLFVRQMFKKYDKWFNCTFNNLKFPFTNIKFCLCFGFSVFARLTGCNKHENEKHAEIPKQFPRNICGKAWNSKE